MRSSTWPKKNLSVTLQTVLRSPKDQIKLHACHIIVFILRQETHDKTSTCPRFETVQAFCCSVILMVNYFCF